MDLVHEVRRVADACHRAPRIDVILPAVKFLVVFEREEPPLVFRLEQKTVWLEVCPFNIRYVG